MNTSNARVAPDWVPVSFDTYRGNPAENYEKYFVPAIGAPHATELMEIAAVQSGERVLDVACGTGVVTRLAADNAGPENVVGLDVNPAMLAVARNASSGSPIQWHEGSAEAMPFDGASFDVVLCQLGLQFMKDKTAALREMKRVLSPGTGRAIVSVAGSAPEPFEIMEEEMNRHLGETIGAFVGTVFSLDDTEELASLFRRAKFRDVKARMMVVDVVLPGPAEFLWQYVHSTPLAGIVSQADETQKAELERAVSEKWEPFVKDGSTHVRINPIVAEART